MDPNEIYTFMGGKVFTPARALFLYRRFSHGWSSSYHSPASNSMLAGVVDNTKIYYICSFLGVSGMPG